MNNNYTDIINAINNDCMIIDDHTNTIITDFRAIVLLNNGKVGLIRNIKSQCINEAYVDANGACHLSMVSISGVIEGVNDDIFEAIDKYNRSYENMPNRKITAIHLVI